MPAYSASIEIAAPPAAVYDRIADVASHGEWSTDPLEVTAVGEGRFRSTVRAKGGKNVDAEIVLVEHVPPERLVFDVVDVTGTWRHTFSLSPTATGTRLTRTTEGKLSGAQLALYWLVLLPVKKPSAAKALAKLKRLLEQA